MTLVVKLSEIKSAADFEAQVAAYIKAKKDHQKTVGEAAPTAPALIEAAVRVVPGSIEPPRADDYVADYKIEDDTPPPPTLAERKQKLADAAAKAAEAAINAISPPLKRRLMQMTAQRAMAIEPAKRDADAVAAIAAANDASKRIEGIYFHLATVEAQIDDLTAETIDAWKP